LDQLSGSADISYPLSVIGISAKFHISASLDTRHTSVSVRAFPSNSSIIYWHAHMQTHIPSVSYTTGQRSRHSWLHRLFTKMAYILWAITIAAIQEALHLRLRTSVHLLSANDPLIAIIVNWAHLYIFGSRWHSFFYGESSSCGP